MFRTNKAAILLATTTLCFASCSTTRIFCYGAHEYTQHVVGKSRGRNNVIIGSIINKGRRHHPADDCCFAINHDTSRKKRRSNGQLSDASPSTAFVTKTGALNINFRNKYPHNSILCSSLYNRNIKISNQWDQDILDVEGINLPPNATLIPFQNTNEELHKRLLVHKGNAESNNEHSDSITPMSVIGYISRKRKIGHSLAFIYVVSGGQISDNKNSKTTSTNLLQSTVQTLWKRQEFVVESTDGKPQTKTITPSNKNTKTKTQFDAYLTTVNPGMKVLLTGIPTYTRNAGEAVLLVQSCRILGLPKKDWRHVKSILEWTNWDVARTSEDGMHDADEDFSQVSPNKVLLPLEEVAQAAGLSSLELRQFVLQQSSTGSMLESIDMEKNAKELIKCLPYDSNSPDLRIFQNKQTSGDSFTPKQQPKETVLPMPPEELLHPPYLHDNIGECIAGRASDALNVLSVKDLITNINQDTRANATNNDGLKGNNKKYPQLSNPSLRTNTTTLTSVTGWVQSRRRYSNSITVLKIVDDFQAIEASDISDSANFDLKSRTDTKEIMASCILHPQLMLDVNGFDEINKNVNKKSSTKILTSSHSGKDLTQLTNVEIYSTLLSRGARGHFHGYFVNDIHSNGSRPSFWVTKIQLQRSSWSPSTINHLLELLTVGKFSTIEAAEALALGKGADKTLDLASLRDNSQRRWRAAELSAQLQDEHSRMVNILPEEQDVLHRLRSLREKFPLWKMTNSLSPLWDNNAERNDGSNPTGKIVHLEKKRTRKNRNVLQNSRFQTRKQPQLQYMVSEIEATIKSHPAYGQRPLHILDIGGGKGHLANALASTYCKEEVCVSVVDIDRNTILNGMRQSIALGLNVTYWMGDASTLDLQKIGDDMADTFTNCLADVDIVVALHACGVLSDVALGHASCFLASFVICPCCFCSNPNLLVSVPSNENRSNNCEGIRQNSESMEACDWLGIDSKQLRDLKKICEIQGDRPLAQKAIHSLCALRSDAVLRYHAALHPSLLSPVIASEANNDIVLDVSLKTFPIGLSTRNICIVGKLSRREIKYDSA